MNTNYLAEVIKIKREIEALDEEFAASKTMTMAEFTKRTGDLRQRQRVAEREARYAADLAAVERAAAPVRPAARPAPRQTYAMRGEDAQKLKGFERALKNAKDAGDESALAGILADADYARLLFLSEKQAAGKFSGDAYAAMVGARISLAMDYLSLAALRRKALENRIAELESAVPRYLGVYSVGKNYAKNAIVTHHGAMWIALKSTDTKPPSDDWQLCVARGRDGNSRKD